MNDSSDPRLAEALRALHGAIDRYDIVAARTLGIGRNDWRALRQLAEQGPQAPRALGESLGLTSGSVTTLIDRLEARGLAVRAPDPSDRRSLVISASAVGAKALRSAYAPLAEITGRSAARMGERRSAAAAKQIADLARLVDWARERV